MNRSNATHFEKGLLPPPSSFYQRELGTLSRPNAKGWAMGNCRFHKSKSHRSLSVNEETGAFHCFGCGARGGDIIDFVRLRDSSDFPSACRSLGVWQDISEGERFKLTSEATRRKQERERALQMQEAEHRLRMGYRSEIHSLEAARREAIACLDDPETSPEDDEKCWEILALIEDELRECLAAYSLLAFGMSAEREEFLMNPAWRDRAVAGILTLGYVRDDAGHISEVNFS